MKKTFMLVLMIFILILIANLCVPVTSYASNYTTDWSGISGSAKNWIEHGKNQKQTIDMNKVSEIVMPIGRILVSIGTVVLVIVTSVMGIKYMLSNPEEKAKLKVQLIGLVVSTIVIFGAQFIWSTLYKFFSTL